MTMLDTTIHVRRGVMAYILCAARALVLKWSTLKAGVQGTSKCGLRGSLTIVKHVFAPSPRAAKAAPVKAAEQLGEALIKTIFKRQPKPQTDLLALACRF